MLTITSTQLTDIVASLSKELSVDVCSLYIATNDNHLELIATYGLSRQALGARMSFEQGLTGRVARTQHSLSVKNPEMHPDYFYVSSSGEEKYHSYLGIPLLREEQLFGVLVVQTLRSKMFFMNEIQSLYEAGKRLMDILQSDVNSGEAQYNYEKRA
jgi:phosphotransferase system enzyme I (PtsP)